MFNVGPVTKLEDGTVISVEALNKRQERVALQKMKQDRAELGTVTTGNKFHDHGTSTKNLDKTFISQDHVHSDRIKNLIIGGAQVGSKGMSKTQEKKQMALESRPSPPKPTIPDNIPIPANEENWLSLWDLDSDRLERRLKQEKKRKAIARKALRSKQQSGKLERRLARDEKRAVYRDIKITWRSVKGTLHEISNEWI